MSAVVETFLICDEPKCGETYGVDNRTFTAEMHRIHAQNDGWRYVNGQDRCPAHARIKPVKKPTPPTMNEGGGE